jgi:hypothetical protein
MPRTNGLEVDKLLQPRQLTIIYECICDVVATLKNGILGTGQKGKTHCGINPQHLVRTNGNEKHSTDTHSDKRSRDSVRAADATFGVSQAAFF